MQSVHTIQGRRKKWVALICLLVVPVALKLGFDFGYPLGGIGLGLAAAVNTALLCALLVDAAVHRIVRP